MLTPEMIAILRTKLEPQRENIALPTKTFLELVAQSGTKDEGLLKAARFFAGAPDVAEVCTHTRGVLAMLDLIDPPAPPSPPAPVDPPPAPPAVE